MPASRSVIGSHRIVFAEAPRRYVVGRNALAQQIIAYGARARVAELQVISFAADAIGVAIYFQPQAWVREDDTRYFRELFARGRTQSVLVEIEQDVRHVDDQSAGGVAGFQD